MPLVPVGVISDVPFSDFSLKQGGRADRAEKKEGISTLPKKKLVFLPFMIFFVRFVRRCLSVTPEGKGNQRKTPPPREFCGRLVSAFYPLKDAAP